MYEATNEKAKLYVEIEARCPKCRSWVSEQASGHGSLNLLTGSLHNCNQERVKIGGRSKVRVGRMILKRARDLTGIGTWLSGTARRAVYAEQAAAALKARKSGTYEVLVYKLAK